MEYSTLASAWRAYRKQYGEEAAARLIVQHGGKMVDGETPLASVPESKWLALHAAFVSGTTAVTSKAKSVAELVASAYARWNGCTTDPNRQR